MRTGFEAGQSINTCRETGAAEGKSNSQSYVYAGTKDGVFCLWTPEYLKWTGMETKTTLVHARLPGLPGLPGRPHLSSSSYPSFPFPHFSIGRR